MFPGIWTKIAGTDWPTKNEEDEDPVTRRQGIFRRMLLVGSPVIPAGNQWIWLGKKLSEKRTRWKTRIMGVYLETGLMGAAQRVSGFGY
jgi:hypothetical protein